MSYLTNFQGNMVDLTFVSGDGLYVTGHRVIAASLGPFMLSLLGNSRSGDLILLPDFEMDEICSFLHLLYTGK